MKQYVKIHARKSSEGFEYVRAMFLKLAEEGVLVGPQINKTLKGNNFIKTLDEIEL